MFYLNGIVCAEIIKTSYRESRNVEVEIDVQQYSILSPPPEVKIILDMMLLKHLKSRNEDNAGSQDRLDQKESPILPQNSWSITLAADVKLNAVKTKAL